MLIAPPPPTPCSVTVVVIPPLSHRLMCFGGIWYILETFVLHCEEKPYGFYCVTVLASVPLCPQQVVLSHNDSCGKKLLNSQLLLHRQMCQRSSTPQITATNAMKLCGCTRLFCLWPLGLFPLTFGFKQAYFHIGILISELRAFLSGWWIGSVDFPGPNPQHSRIETYSIFPRDSGAGELMYMYCKYNLNSASGHPWPALL